MLDILLIWAQEGNKGTAAPFPDLFILLPIMLFLFFVLVILPGRRRERKEREALLGGLNKNDKVLTIAGIYGTVVSVSDKEDEVVVKVDDSTRLRMTKGSIARNFSAEERAKPAQESKDGKKEAETSPSSTAVRKA